MKKPADGNQNSTLIINDRFKIFIHNCPKIRKCHLGFLWEMERARLKEWYMRRDQF